jgi:hypothetical protein
MHADSEFFSPRPAGLLVQAPEPFKVVQNRFIRTLITCSLNIIAMIFQHNMTVLRLLSQGYYIGSLSEPWISSLNRFRVQEFQNFFFALMCSVHLDLLKSARIFHF